MIPPPGGVARVAAPAKVNLFLRVLERRSDGFHELETLFQAVSLADAVEVRLVREGVRLEVDGPDLGPVEENLAVRAARAFLERTGRPGGAAIALRKAIPAGAGLGGGSSDAAAVLRCLDALTGSPLRPEELRDLGATLGSDVPFFLGDSPRAAARGRGELLEPLPPLPSTSLLLVLPPVHVATGAAYRTLAAVRRGGVGEGPRLSSIPASWPGVAETVWNDFQAGVAEAHPTVARSLEALSRAGGRGTLLSGSGAACFALAPDGPAAPEEVARSLAGELGWPVVTVRTLERFPPVETRTGTGA